MVQSYRNTRRGFYTDCYQDTTPIGSIVSNLKSGANSYDHEFVNKRKARFLEKKREKPAPLTRTRLPGLALASPDMSKVRVLLQFRMFWIPN